jgi:hypothetical protein
MNTPTIITKSEAASIRARITAYNAAREKFDPERFEEGGGYTPEEQKKIEGLAGGPDASNEERQSLEVYDFVTNPPERYFVYIDEKTREATAWPGAVLGTVTFGREYRGNLRDTRVPIRVKAINGKMYHGTYFKSAGDYARLRLFAKDSK